MENKDPDETAHVQDDLSLRVLLMFEDIISHVVAHIMLHKFSDLATGRILMEETYK